MLKLIATSPIFNAGFGCSDYRLVLAKWGNEFVVWVQYIRYDSEKTELEHGHYFPIRSCGSEEKALAEATACFGKLLAEKLENEVLLVVGNSLDDALEICEATGLVTG
jgi:hypothetical protein